MKLIRKSQHCAGHGEAGLICPQLSEIHKAVEAVKALAEYCADYSEAMVEGDQTLDTRVTP